MQTKYQQLKQTLIASGTRLLLACVVMIQLASGAYAASVTIAWDPNAESYVVGYNVYRSSQSGAFTSAALNGTTLTTSTSFTDSTAQDSQTYYYVVKAVSGDGTQSVSSNQIQVVTSVSVPALLPPTGLSAQCSADNKNFTIRWNAVAGATNYYVGVDYKANNSAAAFQSWFVAGSPDYYFDQTAALTFTGSVIPGQGYEWWVGANTTAPGTGPWTSGTGFTCNDGTAPTVSIMTPSAGASISGLSTVSADAADNIGVVGVQFKVNGVNLGAEVTSAPYSQPWDTAALSNGSYTLSAVARDLAGNQTTSVSVTVTVNYVLVAPTGLNAQCSADNKNFTIRWNAVAGAANYYVGVDYKANNSAAAFQSWFVAGSPDYYFDQTTALTFTGSVIPGQGYEWWVGANTTAPGTGPWTSGTGFTCGDTNVPTVSITAPSAGASISGLSTVSADAADNIGVVGVQFKVNGVNLGAEVTSAPYSQPWDTAALSNGSYTLSAVARDLAGNQTTSVSVTVTVNYVLVAPTGLNAQCSADNKNFTIRWNAVAGAANYYVGVDYKANNSAAVFQSWFVAGSPDYYFDQTTALTFTGSVIPGQGYEWWVGANTTAPGTGPWTSGTGFTCGDTNVPTVSITAPSAGASISGLSTVSADAADNIGVVGVQFKVNGVNLGAEVTSAPYSQPWDTAALSNGSYTLSAVARDLAGNQTTSVSVTVTVNYVLVAPTGLNAQCSADNKNFTIRWNAVAGATNYYVGVDYKANNSAAAFQSWFVAGSPDYYFDQTTALTFTGSVIPGQGYEWWVGANTTAPGTGPWTSGAGFTCGTAARTISITAPVSGATISGNQVTVSAAASSNVGLVGVQFKLNGVNLGTSDATAPYSTIWNTKKQANGVYSLTAVATDTAGQQTVSAPISVRVQKGAASGLQIIDSDGDSQADTSPETMTSGYARPELQASATAAQGVAIVSLKNGDIVVSETAVPASLPVRQGRVYVAVSDQVNTGLAISNDNNEEALISFYFTDTDGTDFAHGSFTLETKGQNVAFVNQAPFNLPVSLEGSLTFNSSIPVSVAALRGFTNERGEFLMTTLPVTPLGETPAGTSIVFPHVADGEGWNSQVVLTNPTDAPLAGTVQFFGPGSSDVHSSARTMTVNGVTDSTFSYTIAPRSIVRLTIANPSMELQVGYALATAAERSAVPQGLLISSYSNQGVTVSQAGLPAVSTGTAFRTYVESLGSLQSGLAMANPSLSPAQTTFELTALDGTSTGLTASLEIPAGGHVSQFINELFPAIPDGFQGMLRLVSTQPLAVVGMRTHSNERGDFLFTAMPVADEASLAVNGADLVFPLVVNGGGYSTEFVGIQ